MRVGKLPEKVWKRSVLKQIKEKREEVVIGAGIGEDCAVFSLGDGKMTAMSSNVGYWPGTDTAQFPLYRSVKDRKSVV